MLCYTFSHMNEHMTFDLLIIYNTSTACYELQ